MKIVVFFYDIFMGTRSEFVGNKKKEYNAVGLGLRLRMQENPSSSNKRMMVLPHNYYCNYNESMLLSSSSSSRGFYGGGGTGSGSMFCNTSNQVACMSDTYGVVGAAASGSGTSTSVPVSKSLNSPNSDSFFPFNSSGEMAASAVNVNVNVRVPFTAAQLQELERQTLIYKYLTSFVPVPCELLFPIIKNPSSVPPSQPNLVQGSMELGILSINNSDPEPWRCRRTDGKKWRCSRNVAPDQKYCERHSHKSRPRSRKPVELPAHHINNNNNQNNVGQSFNLASNTINKSYLKSHFINQNLASSIPSTGQQQQQRNMDWFGKGETMPVASNSNQEWLQMMQSKLESNRDSCKYGEHHRDHLINSNSCTNLGGDNLAFQAQWLHDAYSLLLSPKMVSHQAQTQETRHFTDAWSVAGGNIANEDGIGSNCFVSPNEKLPLSSLALSMCGGSETFERNENALINTLGSMGCSEGENVVTLRPHWMNHVSGMGSPPGGPLAEALCLGIASSAKSDSNAAALAPLSAAKAYADMVKRAT